MAPVSSSSSSSDSNATSSTQSLSNSKVYTNYFPKFIIGLSILYALSFLIRCIIRKCRRLREKKQQKEIRCLKQTWKNSMKKHQLIDSLLFENGQEQAIINFPPSSYNESFYSTSSSTLNNPTLPYNHSTITFDQQTTSSRSLSANSSSKSTASSRTLEVPKQYYTTVSKKEKVSNKALHQDLQQQKTTRNSQKSTRYWSISNKKRLTILWQWSVSNGYMDYQHAKELNALIDELTTRKQQLCDDDLSKKDSVPSEEATLQQKQAMKG